MSGKPREAWASKLGIVLAVAGSAVGLGNFLRFPSQAVQNGGGAFLIPYFVAVLLLGIPLMWMEWAIGRYGGRFGHGSAPLIFNRLWRHRAAKYFGTIGVFGPVAIFIYYTYIESWLLGYCWYSINGALLAHSSREQMVAFLHLFQGIGSDRLVPPAYLFFLVTFAINFTVIYCGVKGGIERLCKIAMPLLFLFAVILAVRVLTLAPPDAGHPERNLSNGLGFLWNPDFAALKDARVWLAASGQVLFTLSVGIGVIITYASYLSKGDDIVLSGLTAASLNEFAEIVLGGTIVIPLAFMFFGGTGAREVAASGSFNIGFVAMPLVFAQMTGGGFFAFIWFLLLFLAGITSSVSLLEPAVAFLSDDLGIARKRTVKWLALITFVLCQFPIFFLARGVVDEVDFWAGTFFLVVFALCESLIFIWVYGIDQAWDEMHHGAELRIPRIYRVIIKYVTPLFLLAVLGFWLVQQAVPTFLLRGVPRENVPYVLGTRLGLLVLFGAIALCARKAYYAKKAGGEI